MLLINSKLLKENNDAVLYFKVEISFVFFCCPWFGLNPIKCLESSYFMFLNILSSYL